MEKETSLFEVVYPQIWMLQPMEIREHLAKVFDVKRSSMIEFVGRGLVSDGRTSNDLAKAITKEKLSEYTGSPIDTNMDRLWNIAISKARYELTPKEEIIDLCQKETQEQPKKKEHKEKVKSKSKQN